MGEAKRRNRQGEQGAQQLHQRIAAGEFGGDRPASGYLVVIDKSLHGRDALALLRGFDALRELPPLLASDALRMWDASKLFSFAVLCGGNGPAEQRTLLAATLDRLTADVLPRAVRRMVAAGEAVGAFIAVDAPLQGRVEQAVQQALLQIRR